MGQVRVSGGVFLIINLILFMFFCVSVSVRWVLNGPGRGVFYFFILFIF